MQRKLVKMGKNCLMTAVPMSWLKQHNLKKGDYVDFEEVESYLFVSAKQVPMNKEISINMKNANKAGVFRILSTLYDLDFKTVHIMYDTPQTLTWILWSINMLRDWKLELLQQQHCVLRTILVEQEEFSILFRKIMLLTKELTTTVEAYIAGNNNLLEEIRVKHQLILSGTQSIKRRINTSSLPLEYKYYYFIAIQLEEIADHYEYLLRNLEIKKKNSPKILLLQRKLVKLFSETYANFFKFSLDWYIEFSKKEVWKEFATEQHSLVVYHLRAISERIKNIAKYTVGIRIV